MLQMASSVGLGPPETRVYLGSQEIPNLSPKEQISQYDMDQNYSGFRS